MIFSFLIENPFLSIFLALLILVFLKIVIVPWAKINSYKREEAETYFFPVVGHFHRMRKDFEKHGDMLLSAKESSINFPQTKYCLSNMGTEIVITLRDPQYIKEYVQKQHLYKKARVVKALSIFGDGLVMAEGATWKRHRKIISSCFNYEFLKEHTHVIQETTREFLGKINPSGPQDFSAIDKLQEITGEVVGRIFFGKNLSSYSFEGNPLTMALGKIVGELVACTRTPLAFAFGPGVLKIPIIPQYKRLMERIKRFRKTCFDIIQDRKAQKNQARDLLGLLLSTQQMEDLDQRFDDDEIIDEFITFFIAGMDTTGHLAAITLYVLTRYPQYLQELQEERNRTYNTEEHITADTLQKMDILHSILKETMRFYTPVPGFAPREAMEDHDLLDLHVKKGQLLRFELFSMFFNEKFFEKPFEFNPARWRSDLKLDPYVFIPFGAGPRNCIGQHLAILESKIIISEFLERFDFKLKQDYVLRMIFRLTYEPYEDLVLQVKQKNKN